MKKVSEIQDNTQRPSVRQSTAGTTSHRFPLAKAVRRQDAVSHSRLTTFRSATSGYDESMYGLWSVRAISGTTLATVEGAP